LIKESTALMMVSVDWCFSAGFRKM